MPKKQTAETLRVIMILIVIVNTDGLEYGKD